MGSSSDEKFGWTNTSNSETDSAPEKTQDYDGESESGKFFKKKLQKELFQNGQYRESNHEPRERKKKTKQEESSPPASPSPRRVKRESLATGHDDSAAAERLLHVRVKQERAGFLAPSPSPSRASAPTDHDPPRKKKKKRDKEKEEPVSSTPDGLNGGPESPRKKKKHKRESDRESSKDKSDTIVDKFEAEETVVKRRPPPEKKHKRESDRESSKDKSDTIVDKFEAEETVVERRPPPEKKHKRESDRESSKDKSDTIVDKFEAEETVVERRPPLEKVNGDRRVSIKRRVSFDRPPENATVVPKEYPSKEFIEDNDSSSEDDRPAPAPSPAARPASSSATRPAPSPATRPAPTSRPSPAPAPADRPAPAYTAGSTRPTESPRRARISERIMFEEESQSQSEHEIPQRTSERITFEESHNDVDSEIDSATEAAAPGEGRAELVSGPGRAELVSRLGRFLRAHAHMQPVLGELPAGAALTADDDVWLVRCPGDLDVRALQGATLDLEFRCKLKAGGSHFEAEPCASMERVGVLTPALYGAGFSVRAVPVRGGVRIRHKLPRPRAPPAAAAAAESPERVPPPPDTRRRHPLLGADLEPAALPDAVRRRLAAASGRAGAGPEGQGPEGTERREKKKKKHKEFDEPEPEPEIEPEPQLEPHPVRKKRKRKHSSRREYAGRDEPEPERESPPRKKKAKKEKKHKERRDAAVWESARAIEESLFNF